VPRWLDRAVRWQSLLVAIDWRQLLGADDGCELRPGATADEVAAAEAALGAAFPADLREVYQASDGVFDRSGQWFVIWPLAEVVTRNRQAWSWAGPARRGLVGFGDDGTGAPFCVPRPGSGGVFAWSVIGGEATFLAGTVAEFWSRWVSGGLPAHEISRDCPARLVRCCRSPHGNCASGRLDRLGEFPYSPARRPGAP
jgi:hypothetical protein